MKQHIVTLILGGLLLGIVAFGAGWFAADSRETAPAPTYIMVTPEPVATGSASPPAAGGGR
ncbi:hypothetical protein ACFRMQ_18200 [Kitasatospora sp. NPDC056783]|uniref:hypothetical protein n=1 Tax=Kitasatospora sp. NPDC056783 TaxID=3345943 RepID=UPI0036831EE5